MKNVFFLLCVVLLISEFNVQEAKAMDPVTIAILAPYALPVAEAAGKHAFKGLMAGMPALGDMGTSLLSIFLLPVGVLECTVGMPFGFFGDGIGNVWDGTVAPVKFAYSTLKWPAQSLAGAF